jgi:PAS domain S-box-containing protein
MHQRSTADNDNTMTKLLSGDDVAVSPQLYKQLQSFFEQAPAAIAIVHGPTHVYTMANSYYQKVFGRNKQELIGCSIREVWPEIEHQGIYEIFDRVFTTGEPFIANEYPAQFYEKGEVKLGYYDFMAKPVTEVDGAVSGIMIHAVDVTEKALASKKVKKSEQRYAVIAEASELGLWDFDIATATIVCTGKMAAILGLPDSHEMIVSDIFECMHPADRAKQEAIFASIMNRTIDPFFETEYRIIRRDTREVRWIRARGKALSDDSGNIYRTVGTISDITGHQEVELKLRQSEARYRQIFEGTPVSIFEEDFTAVRAEVFRLKKEGIQDFQEYFATHPQQLQKMVESVGVRDVNEAALQLLEASSKEELKKGLSYIFVEDTTAAFIAELETIAAGGGFLEYGTTLQTLKGKRLDVLAHINFPHTSDYSSITITLVDITERKKTEVSLIESEARYRQLSEKLELMVDQRTRELVKATRQLKSLNEYLLLQNQTFAHAEEVSMQGSYSWNLKTGEVKYSDNMFRLLGCKPDDFTPGVEGLLPFVHPDDREAVTRGSEGIISNRQTPELIYRVITRQGEIRYLKGTGKIITVAGESVLVGTNKDVTGDILLREQLGRSNKELQRSNEDLQQFAHVASHDLKEPVRKVRTFANRLKEEIGAGITEKGKTYLSKIENSADRMYAMIDGILLYSSLDAVEQTKERIDLNELMESIEADLELTVSEKKARIIYNNLPTIEGSHILINQLFYNLLNNALKFAKADTPPLINITTSEVLSEELVSSGLTGKGPYKKIELQDNGIGFSNEAAEKIFITFTRLNAKDKYEGTGLGLSLCKKIVERHGGSIRAKGAEGEGAVFEVILPAR